VVYDLRRNYRALSDTRLGAALVGQSRNWGLTALLAGVASKIITTASSICLSYLAWEFYRIDAGMGFSGAVSRGVNTAIVLGALILAPLLESALVIATVWLLRLRFKNTAPIIIMSGVIHVPLHGMSFASLSVWPMFMLHALIVLNWMARQQTGRGYCAIVGAHFVSNSIGLAVRAFAAP
jgi:hypothetical protein